MKKTIAIFFCRHESPMFKEIVKCLGLHLGHNHSMDNEPYIGAINLPLSVVFLIKSEFAAQELQIAVKHLECMYMMFDVTDEESMRQFRFALPDAHAIAVQAFLVDKMQELDNGTLKKSDLDVENKISEERKQRVDQMSMDDLLDIVKEKGMTGLSPYEKQRLDQLSRQ